MGDAAEWVLVVGLMAFLFLVATPLVNRMGRVAERSEQRADETLELTRKIERNTRPPIGR